MLLVDAANVIGSRPDGWWRDRPGAASRFVEQVRRAARADRFGEPVIIVLEGDARPGVEEGSADEVTVIHAPASGDAMLIHLANKITNSKVVSADRALRQHLEQLGATVIGPRWLLERLEG